MNTMLPAVVTDTAIPVTLRAALETAADLASNEKALSTRKAYASDFRIFERWCATQGLAALPADPAAVAGFIADEASRGLKASTLGRRIAAIKYRHKTAGEASPTDDERVKAVVRGARRILGVTARKLTAATAEKTIGMSTLTRGGLAGKRDRAILLLGFALAARRSELVALDVADIEECPEGLRVRIRKSKTDQEGAGTWVVMDAPLPGIGHWDDQLKNPKTWHFNFRGPDTERLVAGRERILLDRFYNELSANPTRIDERTRDHYAALYARPGAIHNAFSGQFAAFAQDAIDNQELLAKGKLKIPVLAIGGDHSYGAQLATEVGFAAADVRSAVISDSGHWIMEEQPEQALAVILSFLGGK